MKHLNLDTEQAAILLDAAEGLTLLLEHRANRLDPDGIVSGAAKLHRTKLANIKAQLQRDPVDLFEDLHPNQRRAFMASVKTMASNTDPELHQIAFRTMRAILLNPMHRLDTVTPENPGDA